MSLLSAFVDFAKRFQLPSVLTGSLEKNFPGLTPAKPKPAPVPTQADFDKVHAATRAEVSRLADQIAAGKITPEKFADAIHAAIEDGHTKAATLGRQLAGDGAKADDLDREFGRQIAQSERTDFLDAFAADLAGERYLNDDGNLKGNVIVQRALMYADRIAGTANETFILASDPDELIDWVLGAESMHCPECPALAAGSPYKASEIPTTPGSGATTCLVKCRCRVVRRSDKREGFTIAE